MISLYSTGLAVLIVFLAACGSTPERKEAAAAKELTAVDLMATLTSARSAYAQKNWREAERHYEILVRRVPKDPEHWFRMANIYARTERPDLAVTAYREVLVRDSNYAKAWFNMGVVQLRQAANSFRKMEVHVDESDPARTQAAEAYQGILDIIGGEGGRAEQAVPIVRAIPDQQFEPIEAPESVAATESDPEIVEIPDAAQAGVREASTPVQAAVSTGDVEAIDAAEQVDDREIAEVAVQPTPVEDAELEKVGELEAIAGAEETTAVEEAPALEEPAGAVVTEQPGTVAQPALADHSDIEETGDLETASEAQESAVGDDARVLGEAGQGVMNDEPEMAGHSAVVEDSVPEETAEAAMTEEAEIAAQSIMIEDSVLEETGELEAAVDARETVPFDETPAIEETVEAIE
ncbi:MAG: tetratricopeptide repeat protein, partial [Gammaproteobacteria bacterium]|nr:tetratricopeptide repeat protein [Gammaproteobacteria bacterium]